MHLAHRSGERAAVFVVVHAKLAIAIRMLGVGCLVLLPQQLQGHPFALELLVNQRVIGLRVVRPGGRLAKQQPLKLAFVQLSR